jgi:hypothetical protein
LDAKETHQKYLATPKLSLVVLAFEYNGSCVGDLSAKVTAMLKLSEMIATGTIVDHPFEQIWSGGTLLAGKPNTFSRSIIQASEEMMKSFVNDWALTQREYPD